MKDWIFAAFIFAVMNQIIAWADVMGYGGYGVCQKSTFKAKVGLHIEAMLRWPFALFPFHPNGRWTVVSLLVWFLGGLGIAGVVGVSVPQCLLIFWSFVAFTALWLIACSSF